MSRYDLATTTLATLLEDPEAVEIVERTHPGISSDPRIFLVRRMTADKVFALVGDHVAAGEVARVRGELEALA